MKVYDLFLRHLNFCVAWRRVLQNQGCAGIDDQTLATFARQADRNLARLRDRVSRGIYRPLPWRQFLIPKSGGDWRELRVPAVRDRVVQQALLNVLSPVMEREFAPVSFAYRPGRSHLMAVRQVAQWRDRGYEWLLDEVIFMLVVVVYDIPDDKRRNKLATFLEGYGRRVQYSVFECFLNRDGMLALYKKVQRRVKPEEDNVRFYWLTAEAVNQSLAIGSEPPQEPPKFYII